MYKKKLCHCCDILIVDDDSFNIKILKNILNKLNFKVAIENGGIGAIEKVKSNFI